MKLSEMGKRIIAVTMAAAVVVSGIVFSPDKTIKAADPEPQVKVLGATVLKDEVTDGNSQSMRLAIQVANASYAEMCGIEVSVEGSTKDPVLVSTDNAEQRKIYSRHENLDIVVYTVVVKDIPSTYFDKKISFRGVVKKIKNDSVYTDTTEYADRTVTGVKEAIEESLDPVAEKKVNLAETNLAYSSKKSFIDNGDGTVTIELERASGGLSVGYYINDNKSPINLNDYSKMVLNVTSAAGQTGAYSIGFSGPYVDSNYWTNNSLKTALGYGIAFNEGTHDYTFTSDKWNGWDASKKTQSVVYIQAQGDSSGESNTFTLNSITLYKNENASKEDPNATAAPIPTPSPTPVPTATPAVTERPAPPAAEAPTGEGWQQIDLTKDVTFSSTSYLSESNSLVMSEEDNVQAKLGATYNKTQVIKVYLTGISYNDNQGFRVWSGGRNNSRTSNTESVNAGSKGVAFIREITLNPADNAEADTFDTITICGAGWQQKISDLEITSIYYKPITVGPKPTLAPGEADISKAVAISGDCITQNDDGSITGVNAQGVRIPIGSDYKTGDTIKVTVYGSATHDVRLWISNGDWTNISPKSMVNPMTFGTEYSLTLEQDAASDCSVQIKTVGSVKTDAINITKVIAKKSDAE